MFTQIGSYRYMNLDTTIIGAVVTSIVAFILKFEFLTRILIEVRTREFLENITGQILLIFSHK